MRSLLPFFVASLFVTACGSSTPHPTELATAAPNEDVPTAYAAAEPAIVEPTVEPATVEPAQSEALGALTGEMPAPGTTPTTTQDAAVMGSLRKEEIRPVIQQQNGRARVCYEQQLMRTPELEGRLVVRFVITRTGTVSAATITQSLHPAVDECIAAMVRGLQFPAPRGGGIVIVNYPFDFVTSG